MWLHPWSLSWITHSGVKYQPCYKNTETALCRVPHDGELLPPSNSQVRQPFWKWIFQPVKPIMMESLADILIAATWQTLSQNHLPKLTTETVTWETLVVNFEAICYAEIDNKYRLDLTSWAYHAPLHAIQRSPFISCLTTFCQNWEWTQPNELSITTQPVMSHFPKHECYLLMRETAKSYCKMACIQEWEEFMTIKKNLPQAGTSYCVRKHRSYWRLMEAFPKDIGDNLKGPPLPNGTIGICF